MAKDPAFLFYPGDYLRDTQCLSENVQVAYDRIMCEHMRNICISKQQLNFFTKKLSESERNELLMVLTKKNDGYQIEWVAESIEKRKAYSDSRSKNRAGKSSKDMNNISNTYDKHMEIENEIVIENKDVVKNKKVKKISFADSEIYDKQKFAERFAGWTPEKMRYFWEAADAYSTEGNKYVDWAKAITQWANREELKGKGKFENKPSQGRIERLMSL